MSVDCIENLKVGDVVCWDSGIIKQTGIINYIGSEMIAVREKYSNREIFVHKSSLLNEDGQSIPANISNPPHAQVLIDLEKEFPDVADDSMLGEVKKIRSLMENIVRLKLEGR